MSLYIDISEFLSSPHRTGIQRVTGELIWHWPRGYPMAAVMITRDARMVRLPENAVAVIKDYFGSTEHQVSGFLAQIESMRAAAEASPHVPLLPDDLLLCPEVFWDPVRIYFYESRTPELHGCYRFIIYDLLVLTHPQYFVSDAPHEIIGRYFKLIRNIQNVAFISRATQDCYCQRLLRISETRGVALRLGSDGLGSRSSSDDKGLPGKRFVVPGTIEPRKNHALVLDAFEPLLSLVPEIELIFVGRIGWADQKLLDRIRRLSARYRNFQVVEDADDPTLRAYVKSARASLFVSAAEGFGLPPVESLWLGTPAVVSNMTPSIEELGERGICRVQPLTELALRKTVINFLDDDFYRTQATQARGLSLPTWSDFARQVAEWVVGAYQGNTVGV